VLPDRIETGTYAFAVAAAGGDVELVGARGARWIGLGRTQADRCPGHRHPDRHPHHPQWRRHRPVTIETQPFPGFPTDLQAQLMALMTKAGGTSVIRETILEPLHARAGAGPPRRHQAAATPPP
jgi:UDP-N-acetylglucosamine 1-carboxyvinyltransferase